MNINKNTNPHFTNRNIKATKVLLLDEENKKIIVSTREALAMAEAQKLDLVQLGQGDCPACKIMDYKKSQYKKNKQTIKRPQPKIKEVQIRPAISVHDLDIKRAKITDFLQKGFDIKIRLKLKGREKAIMAEHSRFLIDLTAEFNSISKSEYKLEKNGSIIGGCIMLKSTPNKKN